MYMYGVHVSTYNRYMYMYSVHLSTYMYSVHDVIRDVERTCTFIFIICTVYMYLHIIDTCIVYIYLHIIGTVHVQCTCIFIIIDTCTVYMYLHYIYTHVQCTCICIIIDTCTVYMYLHYSVLHFTEKKSEDILIIQIVVVKTLQYLILTHLLFPVTPLVKKIERVSISYYK